MKKSGNTILVTGGGSGIGRELAQRWHAAGNTVIVSGRTEATLAETVAGRDGMHAMTLDASDKADIARFARDIVARFPDLNVLVNNAGIMIYEDVTGARDLSIAENMIETNLLGPIRLIDALVDHLKAQDDAAIVNVTSGLAFVPLPKAATYSATKAALHSYTVSLRAKLGDAIEMIELAPPGVQTELTPGQSQRDEYMPLDDYAEAVMAQFLSGDVPAEVLVPNSQMLRDAEKNGSFAQVLGHLNSL